MDKYEYNVKLEQIKKLIRKKDYATAARIADTIDWYKVKNNQTIVLIADVYEASGRYEQARENLKLAYDRSGLGRQIAYKLVKVCIKCGKIDEAEDFYDDFVSAAPRDISKYLLQYELAKAKGEPLEKQISILEQYLEEDMDDRWAFELAKLYHKTGQRDKCIEQCDTVMLWFSDGKYVDKAMDLKMIYTPLTKSQQQRYEARWREKSAQNNIKIEEIKVKEVDVANKYNTQNIQNALKESMDQIFAKEEKAKDEAAELFKPLQKKEPEEPDDYSEADGAAEDADDYIARMALNAMTYENQRKQGMAAVADDEFEEEEEKDDLGDTKIFVTTRSKKNLGDTKVFDPRKLVIPEQVSFEREEQPVKEEKKSEPEEAYIVEEKTIKREEIKEELPEEEPEIEETVEEPVEEEAVEEQPAEETVEEAVEETAETVEEPVEEEAVEEQPAEETVEEAVEETAETVEEPVEEVVEEPVEEIVEEQSVEEEHAEEEVAEKEEIPEEEPEDSTKETVVEVEPGVMEQLMEGLFSDDLFAAATTEPEVKEEPETEEAEETVEEPEIVEAEEAVEEPEIEKAEEAAEEPEIEEVEEAAEEPEIEEVEEAAEEPEIEEVEDEPELEESFDGQYSFGFEEPEEDIEEEQIEGQMSLDDFFNEEGEYHVPEVDEEDDIETEPELDEEEPAVELDEVDEPEEAEVVEEEYDEADEPEVIEEEYEEPDELEVIEEEYDEPDELEIIEEEYDEAVEPEIIGEEAVQDEAEEPEEVREAAVTEEEDEETEENEEIDPFETVTELKIDKNLIKHSSDFEEDSEEPDETDEDGEIEESGEEEPEDDEDEQEDQESEDDEDEKEPLSNQEIKQIIKDFIGKYSGVQGLDKQMLRTLQNVIVDDNCNIFIMGDAKSGKTSLGIDIIKVVNKIKRNNNRRIAKISADKLIGKEMAVYFDKLKGSDLFIENISLMDDDTLEDLLDAIDNDRDSRIIVIEDEKVNADKLLERHGELRDYFANRIVVKQNKIKDWVAIAQEYAEEKGYEIDEIGLLALHAKIDQLYGVTLVIQRNHVENVIDNAIKKAEKGGLFKKFFGRKKDKVLTEEHFN